MSFNPFVLLRDALGNPRKRRKVYDVIDLSNSKDAAERINANFDRVFSVTKALTDALEAYAPCVVQVVNVAVTGVATGSTVIPLDDTIPQNTEGDQYMSLAITPTRATNLLRVDVVVFASTALANWITVAVFQDTNANALAAMPGYHTISTSGTPIQLTFYVVAGTNRQTTFNVRVGRDASASATLTFNGQSGTRFFGGTLVSSISITEINQP